MVVQGFQVAGRTPGFVVALDQASSRRLGKFVYTARSEAAEEPHL